MIKTSSIHYNSSVKSAAQNLPHWMNDVTSHWGRKTNGWDQKVNLGHQQAKKENKQLDEKTVKKRIISISTKTIYLFYCLLIPFLFNQCKKPHTVLVQMHRTQEYVYSLDHSPFFLLKCMLWSWLWQTSEKALDKQEECDKIQFSFMSDFPSTSIILEGDIRLAKVTR